MSKRHAPLLLEDIFDAIENIESYTSGLKQDQFEADRKTVDAVARNLEIIGEAASNIPKTYCEKHADIEWAQIIGLRHRIIHAYFDVDLDIVWHVISNDLGPLKIKIKKLLSE